MKALVVITGRGLGGDAVIALNIIKELESRGIKCEIALDSDAPGILFKKKGYTWHKIKIPQAGGHAATKLTTVKAAFKMLKSTFQVKKLIKEINADFVVGVIGGGAIVGCVGAKLSKKPAVGIISTPLDTKVCLKLNPCIGLPEAPLFKSENVPNNFSKSYLPIDTQSTNGNKYLALEKLKKYELFDENKKTILFSSGSSLFEGTVKALSEFSKVNNGKYNLLLIGHPLKEEYLDMIDENKVINLGYIDWVDDLFDYIDLAVLTDDGIMLEEAIACKVPIVCLLRVKYGRYHDMASIFKGAIIESEVEDIAINLEEAMNNLDEISENAKRYSKEIIVAREKLVDDILEKVKK